MTTITSKDNPKIKQVRSLRQRSQRQATGLFLVEGIRHVGEAAYAAAEGRAALEYICYAPDLLTSEFAQKLIAGQIEGGVPCYAIPGDLFASLAEKENPQGILAVVRQNLADLNSLNPQNFPWAVALQAPQDPGNIGSVLRTIDAVGASGLLLLDSSADPHHPSVVRASMGSLFWYPVVTTTFDEFVEWSSRSGYHIYGTSAHNGLDYRRANSYEFPLVLLMGSEREGLSERQAGYCRRLLTLPMRGRVTSLNLAIAAGVLLYDIYAKTQPVDLPA